MKKFIELKSHLADNTGDENVSKLIWIVIVFVVGALMLTLMNREFSDSGTIGQWLQNTLGDWFTFSDGSAESRPV